MVDANIQGLDNLDAWKKALDFSVMIYQEAVPLLPIVEK